jgi:gentisate 1,2-dioxygenase
MLKRSDIVSSEQELNAFYQDLEKLNATPLWTQHRAATAEPQSKAAPCVWHWRDLRPQAMRATELVGTQQAERRVLILTNPGASAMSATNTITANIQVVMPGEIARAHRHTPAALRMVIESKGGYTAVNGEKLPMLPGDLILTPNWTWHDHANDTDEPMIWLDGLDAPIVRMLEAGFQEPYEGEAQPVGEGFGKSLNKYGSAGLRPAWEAAPTGGSSPLWRYPYTEAKAALEKLAAQGESSPFDGVILEYTNPVTGGPAMTTMGCYIQLLRPGERTRSHRHTSNASYHVVEGEGYSIVGGQRLDWEDKDVFVTPIWTWHEHVNTGNRPAILFSHTDIPVMRALDLYREQTAE